MPSDPIGWFLYNLSRTAIHEAGHLVAHLLYRGAYIDRMTVHPWSKEGPEGLKFFAGCVNTGLNVYAPLSLAPPERREFKWRAMRDRLKECAAGIVAERYAWLAVVRPRLAERRALSSKPGHPPSFFRLRDLERELVAEPHDESAWAKLSDGLVERPAALDRVAAAIIGLPPGPALHV